MFSRFARPILILALLGLSAWMIYVHREGLRTEDPSATLQADGKLRAYVMTQDIEFLRNDLIELHKKHEELVRREKTGDFLALACWSAVFGSGLILMGLELIRRRHA
jgi:hypothetical protein